MDSWRRGAVGRAAASWRWRGSALLCSSPQRHCARRRGWRWVWRCFVEPLGAAGHCDATRWMYGRISAAVPRCALHAVGRRLRRSERGRRTSSAGSRDGGMGAGATAGCWRAALSACGVLEGGRGSRVEGRG
ncbi:hypothetical protein P171DRAFT_165480 [Karstenula rhodostoma CBS 690.94]|uniref:Uncharacterized protein n=1 Tax=Karstenula rhodostoma CBS 690.94 TaxID=1392251 RepID=A0A9P4U6H4_9PLEO|nr:hypothetical protein P171DRAFT_165480 [Karstenula rhodostoma CBS 690.94]